MGGHGVDHRFAARHSLRQEARGLVDDEDGGVDHDSDEHQHSEEDENRHAVAADHQRPDDADDGHRERQQHECGAEPGFEDGAEGQEREEDGEEDGFAEVGDGVVQALDGAAGNEAVARREDVGAVDGVEEVLVDLGHGGAAPDVAEELDGTLLVHAVDLDAGLGVDDVGDGFEVDGAALSAGQEELADLVLAGALGELDADVVGAVAALEAGGLEAFDVAADERAEGGGGEGEVGEDGALGDDADFGLGVADGGFEEGDAGEVARGVLGLAGGGFEGVEVGSDEDLLDVEVLAAHHGGGGGGAHAVGVFREKGADFREAVLDEPGAFGLGDEEELDLAHVDAFGGLAGHGLRLAGDGDDVAEVGQLGEARFDFADARGVFFQVVVGRALDADEDAAVVGFFHEGEAEAGRAVDDRENQQGEEGEDDGDGDAALAGDGAEDGVGVEAADALEGGGPRGGEAGDGRGGARAGAEEEGGEDGREGEGDEDGSGVDDEGGQREGREDAADEGGHHGDGEHDDDVGAGGGEDGDGDFGGAVARGGPAVGGGFELGDDVFENDDGVGDEHAGGEADGEEGDDVERLAEDLHEEERDDDGDGHRQADDDGGADVHEEREEDERAEEDGGDDGADGGIDGAADEFRFVEDPLQLHAAGEFAGDGLEALAGFADDLDDVAFGLLGDGEVDAGAAVGEGQLADFFGGLADGADVADAQARAVLDGDFEAGDVGDGFVLGVEAHGELGAALADVAAGDGDDAALEGRGHVGDGEAGGGEAVAVELHPHLALVAADDVDARDAGDGGEAVGERVVGVVVELVERRFAGKEEARDGRGVDVHLLDDGAAHVGGEVVEDGVDFLADVLRGDVLVGVEAEFEDDVGGVFERGGEDVLETVDAGDGVFDGLGDVLFEVLGRGAGPGGEDGDVGDVDGGDVFERELAPGVEAEADEGDDEARHRDGAAGGSGGEEHGRLLSGFGGRGQSAAATTTESPSASWNWPSETTLSPGSRPEAISVQPSLRRPVATGRSETRPPLSTKTQEAPERVRMASEGTPMAVRVSKTMEMSACAPGASAVSVASAPSRSARISKVRRTGLMTGAR